jgi:transglutaminase-like putative cysteine protease
MRLPPFLLGAAALFWGWESGRLLLAVPMAIVLELWHWTRLRWDVAPVGFQRVADLCTWVFLIAAGYLTFSKGLPVPILPIVEWLPVVMLPLLAAQVYSTAGHIELAALFISLRRPQAGRLARMRVDLGVPFVIVCLLSAGAANTRSSAYFAGTTVLVLWMLWCARPRRRAAATWVLVASAAAGAGYAGHVGLAHLQAWMVNVAIDYLSADLARTDPYRASTDIGHIGELKTSERILLRVSVPADAPRPLLLHRASYNAYNAATWVARDAAFAPLVGAREGTQWTLAASTGATGAVRVSESLPQGRGVLSLPAGAVQLAGLPAGEVRRNRLGTVQVERPPGAATYVVHYADDARSRDEPMPHDLRVPAQELAGVEVVVRELGLRDMSPSAAVGALQRHFETGFQYSTFRADRVVGVTALSDFLLRSKSGHCEYYATATVLIARAAGIPARYATGYSVQEWSELEGRYVVRERHAHAWARVYVDGVWQDVDTTPPQWFAQEAQQASAWEPVRDLGSWIAWSLSAWRSGEGERSLPGWSLWALLPLFVILAWRIHRTGGFSRARRTAVATAAGRAWPGADSAFYRIEARIAGLGFPRAPHETLSDWVERVRRARADLQVEPLRALLALHYRYRFDPAGLEDGDRGVLAQGVEQWLAAHRKLR